MKILLVGATGTLGRQIAKNAIEQGHEVRCFVRNPRKASFLQEWGCELTKGNYKGGEMAVAKKMLSFSGSTPTVYNDIFKWAADNTDMISSVSFDFKGSGKGRYTALKMDYTPISDPIIYSKVLDKIMEEEWSNMQQELQEGLRDWVMSKWRSGKEAISNMVDQVKKLYQKYVKEVITKFLQTIKDAAARGVQNLLNFLGLEISASVSFGKM